MELTGLEREFLSRLAAEPTAPARSWPLIAEALNGLINWVRRLTSRSTMKRISTHQESHDPKVDLPTAASTVDE